LIVDAIVLNLELVDNLVEAGLKLLNQAMRMIFIVIVDIPQN
jgi:hypothetical protein